VRAVVQRATRASVTVDGAVVGSFEGQGLVVLVGVTPGDGPAQVEHIARKIAELRILRDERSAAEVDAPVLVVSQFTLYGDTRKGRRPTWNAAAAGPVAEPLVDAVVADLRARGLTVPTGVFGADMAVELVNDGPVTLLLESAPTPENPPTSCLLADVER
jgi:D-tyrosyl-tRNA(Tyr) deacylase